jgi:hypothetical protein
MRRGSTLILHNRLHHLCPNRRACSIRCSFFCVASIRSPTDCSCCLDFQIPVALGYISIRIILPQCINSRFFPCSASFAPCSILRSCQHFRCYSRWRHFRNLPTIGQSQNVTPPPQPHHLATNITRISICGPISHHQALLLHDPLHRYLYNLIPHHT